MKPSIHTVELKQKYYILTGSDINDQLQGEEVEEAW